MTHSNIYVDDLVVDESQSYADFIVRLDKPNTGTVTVDYSTYNGTATANGDFEASSGSLTFAAGETEKTVRITLLNDASPESLQNFFLRLTSPSANATVADEWGMASIVDNDAASGTPVASITDAVIDESAQTVSVTVILDKPSTGNVTLNVGSQNVIATDGGDFRSFPFGKVAFLPGEVAKTVVFGILNDTAAEGFESFDVVLSSPVGATIGDAISHVVIANSDAAPSALPSLTVADAAASETKGTIDFLVSLSAPSASQVTVNYSTSNGTSTSGGDFSSASGTLLFAPGDQQVGANHVNRRHRRGNHAGKLYAESQRRGQCHDCHRHGNRYHHRQRECRTGGADCNQRHRWPRRLERDRICRLFDRQ
ncbi:hypothetical protein HC024_07695 [Methylococcaceae bacterium WWC4]|nr:hypothetical protein [Methylococcaceae bacterium WWC4]